MGWAQDGAATSSIVSTATITRAFGLGGGGLESATACCVIEVTGPTTVVPGAGCEVPGPVATAAVPGPPAKVPGPTAEILEANPTVSGAADTKIESDSSEGLMDGLRRRRRDTPAGMACRVELIRAKASS